MVKAAKSALEGKTVDGKALSDLVRERLTNWLVFAPAILVTSDFSYRNEIATDLAPECRAMVFLHLGRNSVFDFWQYKVFGTQLRCRRIQF